MGDAAVRANFASSVKRIYTYTTDTKFTTATIEEVQVRLERLETVWKQFSTENAKVLLNLTSMDDNDEKLNEDLFAETEEMYIDAKVKLKQKINQLIPASGSTAPAALGASNNSGINESIRENITVTIPNRTANGLQLAPERLPDFSGDYAQWPRFRDLFKRLVDEDDSAFPLAKFNALDQHLKGEAAALIAGIPRRDENYKLAWDTVFKAYDNPKLIIYTLLDSLHNLRPMNEENPASLRFILTRFKAVTQQLAAADVDVTTWDPLLIYNLSALLDPTTRKAWELENAAKKTSTLEAMLEYLENRVTGLINFNRSSNRMKSVIVRPQQSQQQQNNHRHRSPAVGHISVEKRPRLSSDVECPVCKGNHTVPDCKKFLELNCFPRMQRARSLRLCFGCLARGHALAQCDVPLCQHCSENKRHHPLLCFLYCDKQKENGPVVAFMSQIVDATNDDEDLLATAIVGVQNSSGHIMNARALCDNGGQTNLITEDFVRTLQIHRRDASSTVTPVGDSNKMPVRGVVTLIVSSLNTAGAAYQVKINALVMRRITPSLPQSPVDIGQWPAEVMDNLADPSLATPGRIDLLLGNRVWTQIVLPNIQRSSTSGLMAQESLLGWLLCGAVNPSKSLVVATLQANEINEEEQQLSETIQQFWELEALPEEHHRSAEEQFCADVFEKETFRDESGRYVVSIPIDPDAALLGDSRSRALHRWYQIENRFAREPDYHREYVKFMRDYIDQGHMSLVETPIGEDEEHYFIPHHGILNARKKFRVVFDGSAKTTSGQSLNDIQMKGERLQDNLADIILRFRLHKIALTADVRQMYRQILINEEQRKYQLIFFRENPMEEIKVYRLNTVTYGLKHAPHSAVSALQRCARDHLNTHPSAAAVAKRDYYMDDLSSGDDTENEVITLYREMKSMMRSGGFPLTKWATNNWNVLTAFDTEDIPKTEPVEFNSEEIHSVLGTYWNPMSDQFLFTVGEIDVSKGITKRIATSELAKLFDPTGLLAAVIARGKLLIRQLWLNKIDWDEKLTEPLLSSWKQYFDSLKCLTEIRIPRWINTYKHSAFELHGFCDASEAMYAAVIYYRTTTPNGIRCGILAAKTKVAPLKTITIPRLELSGAWLLSRLMTSIKNALRDRQEKIKCMYWSDSSIVLSWLMQSPHTLKCFVANRVSKIQTANPADLASRGIDASDLVNNDLWWHGPEWLALPKSEWPGSQSLAFVVTETDKNAAQAERLPFVVAVVSIDSFWIANRFSSFTRLCLVTSFIMRFIKNCKAKRSGNGRKQKLTIEHVHPLNRDEYQAAERFWLMKAQSVDFPNEIKACKENANLPRSSKLYGLSPFLDSHGLLRVGGRLANAPIPYTAKYPIFIDGHSTITKLIIKRTHLDMLHGGSQLTTRTIREKYWIIGGRNAIRKIVHECVVCVKMRGQTCTQQMADLVKERVQPIAPFTNVSVDYCGPFEVKRYPGRCRTLVKVWVSVFICMSTRAIHLEVVHDLTSDAFIDAFQRFAARRGYCATIISDNAKTFVGAKRQMLEIEEIFRKSSHSSLFSTRGIEWKFIMPRSPSQGGSHEVAVKLFKHHLWRVMGTNLLSVPEISSLVTRIEGCLNSRPLAIQTEDPNDHIVVTPAQLIRGSALVMAPPAEPILENEPLTNHHLRKVQYWHQDIWRQWQSDYINNLQCRGRWQNKQPNLQIGDIVVIKEDNMAPQHWLLAKVTEVHPGNNNCVRNVTLKCGNGSTFKRAVQKLCKLPVGQDVTATMP